jgi:hypothetical protein
MRQTPGSDTATVFAPERRRNRAQNPLPQLCNAATVWSDLTRVSHANFLDYTLRTFGDPCCPLDKVRCWSPHRGDSRVSHWIKKHRQVSSPFSVLPDVLDQALLLVADRELDASRDQITKRRELC